jgi:type I restriction enzyme S subunit
MKTVFLEDIAKVRTGKYDANHGTFDGNYKFYTCAYGQFKAPTFSFEGEAIVLPGNGANVGEVFFNDGEKFEAYQRTYVIENIKEHPKYVYMYFKSFWKESLKNTQYGSTTNYIRLDNLTKFKIPIPSLSDQIRIAEVLTQAENLITQRKESILLIDELLKSTFLEMFGDPVKNEKGWDKDSFDNLVDSDCPLTYGIVQPGEEFANGVPVIRPVDLTKTYINRTGLKLIDPKISDKFKRTLLKGKEILMCVRGTTGVVALASKELADCNVTRGIVPIWFSNNYNTFFAFGLLKTKSINNEIQSLTYGATLQQINLSDLRKIKLINPPIELQNQYGLIVEKVETLKKEYEASLKGLENMYGVLSQKAFKGELDIK